MRLGFVGTGTITAAMVRGLKRSRLRDWHVLLSPRNPDIARGLADELPGVAVAADNQAVIDGADMVVLAVRPDAAETILRGLRFRGGQPVISLIAATPAATITEWTGATQVCRAIPLPFVEEGRDVTPVYPPHPDAMLVFDALGKALPVEDLASFDVYGALSALMAQYFGMIETVADWAARQGMPADDARAYLSGLYHNLGTVLRDSPQSLPELRLGHSTVGGLNEQVCMDFTARGGNAALTAALDAVLARIKASA